MRASEYNEEKHGRNYFKDEDYEKYNSFKKVKDQWGLDLPETSHNSEIITDNHGMTKKKLSEYSLDIQDRYDKLHKENLDKNLNKLFKRNYVFVRTYKDNEGENVYDVSEHHAPKSIKKSLSSLTESEKTQVLRLAQQMATKGTKKKNIWYKKLKKQRDQF